MLLLAYLIGVSLLVTHAIPRNYSQTIQEHDDNVDHLTRDRRLMRNNKYLWPKAIVPYIYRASALPTKHFIKSVMAFVEDQSCGRYVHWNQNTSTRYGLGHEDHIQFRETDGCATSAAGQSSGWVSCCTFKTCLHELAHVFSVYHENINPRRDGWIRINLDNLYDLHKHDKPTENYINASFPYDITSVMNAAAWVSAIDSKRGTYTKLFPELSVKGEYYYLFREIASGYKCYAMPQCKGKLIKCENEGYQTILHGRCTCKCPTGLDSDNLCKTPLKKVTATWPKGQYALPMPHSGCDGVFQHGRVLYSGTGGNSVSNPSHLIGEIDGTKVDFQFCAKTTKNDEVYDFPEGEKFNWPHGSYCVYKMGNRCPKDFTTNTIYHNSVTNPSVSGKVPDGVYGSDIKLHLCCSFRGFVEEPASFPVDKPFMLFKFPLVDYCQTVEGMRYTEETFTLTSTQAMTVDPLFKEWQSDDLKSMEIKLCHYTPVDMDCGGTITLSKSNPEATIEMSGSGRTDLQCTWVFRGDTKNGTVVLDFEDFDLKKNGDSCDDQLEVRFAMIGQYGQAYKSLECPSKLLDPRKSIRSIYDKIQMTFSTYGNSKSSFKARVRWTADEDMCYNTANRGADYDGSVNHTRSYFPCLPWVEMAGCPNSPFLYEEFVNKSPMWVPPIIHKDAENNLDGNTCRNPDNSFRPWCYTDRKGCMRDYCDVCGIENPFDRVDYCQQLRKTGFCTRDAAQAVQYCAKTCLDLLHNIKPEKKYTEVSCGPPAPPSDGTLVGTQKPKYKVGDTVQYKCNKVSNAVMARCLTSGQWSEIDSSCLPCPSNRIYFNEACYGTTKNDRYHLYETDIANCISEGGVLTAPKSAEETDIIRKIADEKDYSWLWIAIKETDGDGIFRYEDGTEVVWENWDEGEPISRECSRHVAMKENKKWASGTCNYPYSYVCVYPISESLDCTDIFTEKCSSMLDKRPSMCVDQPQFAGQYCRKTCGFCKEKETKCPAEKPNINVVALSIHEPTISVGEIVTSECDKFKYKIKGDNSRVCLPTGKLSGEALVCGDCPFGFKMLNNACHGLVMDDEAATFSDARDVCKKVDGFLALPKTQADNDLIFSLGMGRTIRIGLSDKHSEYFVWDDGVYMSNWDIDMVSGKTCFVMNGDKKWVAVDCGENHAEYPIVCTLPDKFLCYDNKDQGISYDGRVNYTDTFEPCRPWAEAKCNRHSFRLGDEEDNLEGNYCRNPDESGRPWCYTDDCRWAYCDVCGTLNPTDEIENCQELKEQGLCTNDVDKAKEDCIATCRDELYMAVPVVRKYMDIRCGPPQPPIDGVVVGRVRGRYHIGDTVEIKCKSEPWSVFSKCLSSGQWSDTGFACMQKDCMENVFDNICFDSKRTPAWYYFSKAEVLCRKANGTIAVPRSVEESRLIMEVVDHTYTWLGIKYQESEGKWVYQNGSQVEWTNWDDGEPDQVKLSDGDHCATMNKHYKWEVEPCDSGNRLTCAAPRKDLIECSDFFTKCPNQLAINPSMCTEHVGYSRMYCPKTCGLCSD